MELREWLIILGLALVTLIVVDGVRRLQRQRHVPRLDEVKEDTRSTDPDELAREAEINWELPNGGARVLKPADYSRVQPKPKLERQEHPGPSRVLAGFRRQAEMSRADNAGSAGGVKAAEGAVGSASVEASAMKREPVREFVTPSDPEPLKERSAAGHDPTGNSSPVRGAASTKTTFHESVDSTSADPIQSDYECSDSVDAGQVETRPVQTRSAQTKPAQTKPAQNETVQETHERREPSLSALDEESTRAAAADEPLVAHPDDHDSHTHDDEHYRLVDLEGMGDSFKNGSRRMGASVQRFGASLQKTLAERREHKRLEKVRREKEKAEKAALDAEHQRLAREQALAEQAAQENESRRQEGQSFASPSARKLDRSSESADAELDASYTDDAYEAEPDLDQELDQDLDQELEPALNSDKVRAHPVLEKALRHDVSAEHARETLGAASELIVISVMSRDDEGFSGAALLDLMMACGLRYDRDMKVFHRFETEDSESRLQFSMVNVVKPGNFPIAAMDEFRTPGITLLMPLPGADDPSAAFEAMVETAMVIVRHLGGELKDENHSVMTAQTVEFARQRVQEFVRRHRLHRYQVN
ncbi:cell division protein ZipA [Halomonas tibetensis]|uniref:Cell division protein ZipA n=1 Tax=Halomonas tibetensis TaxID=2259590 RepID=A0ABV7B4D9_9GAMM